ncbi:hypothetical protein FYK55_01515 [Roseiconus nitratireducens]|uniref:Uncharacterized protein n=1 Tax=Roseiconus nitratireducens TaxID=2605748 RepID=A0A5M6DI41_9BACT|nr:hypothetical protein [Roseiconus nitratireducens]KAA5547123.1 hypothetical protein FYK55_01515 [Roseiconus nitratireducens]
MRQPRFRFRLSTVILVVTLIAVVCGWWHDRNRLNRESAALAEFAYRVNSRAYLDNWNRTHGGFLPQEMLAQFQRQGTALDLRYTADRSEMVRRLRHGDLDFLVRTSNEKIVSGIGGAGWIHGTLQDLEGYRPPATADFEGNPEAED